MKKQKSILVLLGVFVLLIVVYLLLGKSNVKKQEAQSEKAESEKIQVTNIEDMQKLSYSNETAQMSFVKSDEKWVVADNTAFPLSQDSVEAIENLAGKLTAVRELEASDQLSDYGLVNPLHIITMTDKNEKETKLLIGNGAGTNYYMMVDGKDTVYTVASSLVEALTFDLNEMIELETFPTIGQAEMEKVTVTVAGVETVYSIDVTEDADAIINIASGLGALNVESCVDYAVTNETLASYGLDEATRTKVEVVYTESKDEEKKTFVLYVGALTEDGASNYVQIDGSQMVNKVAASAIKNVLGGA